MITINRQDKSTTQEHEQGIQLGRKSYPVGYKYTEFSIILHWNFHWDKNVGAETFQWTYPQDQQTKELKKEFYLEFYDKFYHKTIFKICLGSELRHPFKEKWLIFWPRNRVTYHCNVGCQLSTTATVRFTVNYVPQRFSENAPYSFLHRFITI